MDSTSQVILILKLALNIAPPALYFVILGLVNSQSKPHLISSRNDWLALVCVFFPVVVYPSIVLANWGYYMPALGIIAAIGIGLMISLPNPGTGWVIYNTSKSAVRKLITRTLDKHSIEYKIDAEDDLIIIPREGLIIKMTYFAILRNVTVSLDKVGNKSITNSSVSDILENELSSKIAFIESGLNVIGPAMLIAGSSMLILPLIMMIRHIDAFVRVVSDLLPV